MSEEFLKTVRISKSFAGVQALDDVSLTIQRGEISCLVGENGSGKSTFIKIICGVYAPDGGELYIGGRLYRHLRPIDAVRAGVQVIFQDFSLFPNLTVAENIALNAELAQGKRLVNWGEVRRIAREGLERVGVDLPLNASVGDLPVADKQLIAIARALLQNARLIIMDEPTTALTQKEVEALFGVVKSLQAKGISILFVSHKLNEVQAIAERVIVFRNGSKVLEAPASEMTPDKITYHMTGHEIAESRYDFAPKEDKSLLKVTSLSRAGGFADISFEVKAGEIVGITGLLGSGRTELALALFGVEPAESGTIAIDGQQVAIRSIQDAVRHGIGYVPEDRLTEGLFLGQSIANNIVVRSLQTLLNRLGLIDTAAKETQVQTWVGDLHIKTNNPQLPVRSLSGGNQQRVVIAKWLASLPKVLILNGPTVGVDVGSKAEIHDIIKTLAGQGLGILVISDDIPELMQVCNRILLMQRGRLADQFAVRDVTEADLSDRLLEVVH